MHQQAALGDFVFSIAKNSAYDRLTRRSTGGWVTLETLNAKPSSQNTGQGLETITISGSVYGAAGMEQMNQLRALQAQRKPLALVTGQGDNHGRWKLQDINEEQKRIIDDGTPLVINFSITLEEFAE
uniref:Tail protein n=1 Tax=viral metagenome TaxID=1070528 RepID=A0A6M3KNW0_9ZZZZ